MTEVRYPPRKIKRRKDVGENSIKDKQKLHYPEIYKEVDAEVLFVKTCNFLVRLFLSEFRQKKRLFNTLK